MKKISKIILITVLTLVLLLSLCGCDALDEMRSQQAYNMGYSTIIWNGETYKALPPCEYLSPELGYEASLYVTREDVPVLLSTSIFIDRMDVSADRNFLINYGDGIVYCKEALHADLSARIRAPFKADFIGYSYSFYNEDAARFEDRHYQLSQKQLDALQEILLSGEPVATGEDIWKNSDINWDLTLYEASEDRLFRKDYVEIWSGHSGYFLLVYGDTTALYEVPLAQEAVIQEIVREFRFNNGFNTDSFTEEDFYINIE